MEGRTAGKRCGLPWILGPGEPWPVHRRKSWMLANAGGSQEGGKGPTAFADNMGMKVREPTNMFPLSVFSRSELVIQLSKL